MQQYVYNCIQQPSLRQLPESPTGDPLSILYRDKKLCRVNLYLLLLKRKYTSGSLMVVCDIYLTLLDPLIKWSYCSHFSSHHLF